MWGTRDKAQAGKDRTKGKFQHAWGELTNNPEMKARGRNNKSKGNAKRTRGRIKNALSALRH